MFRTHRWYRRHWPHDVQTDPRFEGYDHRVAELWADGRLAGYMYMLVLQSVTTAGPPWRRALRHVDWLPEVHFAFRPSPDEPIAHYDFDSIYGSGEPANTDLYRDAILSRTMTWDGQTFSVTWIEAADETRRIIDQHFFEYEQDLSKPE